MDMNFLGGLWVSFPENRPDNGTGWSQATYQFTPTGGYQLHSSTSHSPNEAVQPSSLTNHTLPPLNTILNTDSPSSSFSSSLLIPRLRRHRSHNQENQRGRNVHSHDFHLVRTPLRRGTSRLSLSREHTPVSRPASIGSWNSEEASVTTLPSWPSQVQESFIDLTADSSPVVMLSGSRKRSAVESRITDDASALCSKRLKVESRPLAETLKNTAELDLRDVEDNEGLARVFEEQRIASVKAQQAEANKPVSFSNLQCVICMEPMTNITVTHCGHLFCHSCLMEALIAGEQQGLEPGKGPSKCPVCRKKIVRPKDNKANLQVIPLEIKCMSRKSLREGGTQPSDSA